MPVVLLTVLWIQDACDVVIPIPEFRGRGARVCVRACGDGSVRAFVRVCMP